MASRSFPSDQLNEEKALNFKLSQDLLSYQQERDTLLQYSNSSQLDECLLVQQLQTFMSSVNLKLPDDLPKLKDPPDLLLVQSVTPLLKLQQVHICQLEQELEISQSKLMTLSTYSAETEQLHQAQLAQLHSEFMEVNRLQKIKDNDFTQLQNSMRVKEEQIDRINNLLRQECESLETKNKLLVDQLKSEQKERQILSERNSQLRHLIEQVSQERDKTCSENVQLKVQNQHQGEQIKQVQTEIAKRDMETKTMIEKVQMQKTEIDSVQAKNQGLQAQIQILEKTQREVCQLQDENKDLSLKTSHLQQSISKYQLQHDKQRSELSQAKLQEQQLQQTISSLSQMLEASEARCDALDLTISELRQKHKQFQEQQQSVVCEPERYHEPQQQDSLETDELKMRVDKILLNERTEMRAAQRQLEQELQSVSQELTDCKLLIQKLEQELKDSQEDYKSLERQLTLKSEQFLAMQSELLAKLDQERDQNQKQQLDSLASISNVQSDLMSCKFELENCKESLDFYKQQFDSCKSELNKMETDHKISQERLQPQIEYLSRQVFQLQREKDEVSDKAFKLSVELEAVRGQKDAILSDSEQRQRVMSINWQTQVDRQQALAQKYKKELESTVQVYESALEEARKSLKESMDENIHWRVEIRNAVLQRQKQQQ